MPALTSRADKGPVLHNAAELAGATLQALPNAQ